MRAPWRYAGKRLMPLPKSSIEAVVSNDVFPNTPLPIEDVSLETLRQSVEALLIFPYRLTQLLLPPMKLAHRGTFVFVTSARYLQPEAGFSVATTVRAGTTAFALALAKEAAPFGIQVNVVAPNYLVRDSSTTLQDAGRTFPEPLM